MAAIPTIQEFLKLDLPDFGDGLNTTSIDSNANESQVQATTTTDDKAPSDKKLPAVKHRGLEAGKSTQAWATGVLAGFQVDRPQEPWYATPEYDKLERFLVKHGDISVPNQPPSGNVRMEPSTEQDVVCVHFDTHNLS